MARRIVEEHSPAPEEVMAYLDGELAPERAAAVHEHLLTCGSCQQLREEFRQTSSDLRQWTVEPAPATLAAPRAPKAADETPAFRPVWWRRRSFVWQLAGSAALLTIFLVIAVTTGNRKRPVFSEAAAVVAEQPTESRRPIQLPMRGQTAGGAGGRAAQPSDREAMTTVLGSAKPMIARTARLRITTGTFDAARPAIERILRDVNGFVGQIDVTGSRGTSRSLNAMLRVPADRLDQALTALRALGQAEEESVTGEEIAEQMIDLDVRLSNARTTEKRLRDLLTNRTGDVADVLSVEREIMRVRGEIERLEAERKNLASRVAYATMHVQIGEQRKAGLDLGPLPVPARLRNAMIDGWRDAVESALWAALVALRAAPVLLFWGLVLFWPARMVWRRAVKGVG